MTLKEVLGFVIDYGKFIATLWSSYILLVSAMIGWLISLRSQARPLDARARRALIASYVLVTLIAAAVIWINSQNLIHLMEIAAALAEVESKGPARTAYESFFQVSRNKWLLNGSVFGLLLVMLFIVSLIHRLTDPAKPTEPAQK